MLAVKDYIYGALILLLICGFVAYTIYERDQGAQSVVTADTRAATKQEIKNVQSQSAQQVAQAAAVASFQASNAAPAAPAPAIVCAPAASSPKQVPSHGSAGPAVNGRAAVPEESDGPSHAAGFDPAPAVIEDAKEADAQIRLLQAEIRSYQAAGVVAK